MSEDNSNHIGSKKTNQPALEISNLKRREIQSPLMACLLAGFISEVGYDKAMEVASAAIQMDAMRVGKTMAEKYGGNTIKVLHRVISEVWAEENALVFSILEETCQSLSFNVTRCLYAELYNRLGMKEFGFCLSCNRDAALINGFNLRMKLLRTQTIMQGAEICDFRIVVE
ncbi:MAG: L-2-amino-thiazoline-4-carboxylic acid hydrolase [Chloroflexi bacterium]|nr:L-2-amino-thiazoline-4-carboxylic acid hydrolase [Chloroflexota bacterium]